MDEKFKDKDLFSHSNSEEIIHFLEHLQNNFMLNVVKAFARSAYQCVFVIDYSTKSFLHVSNNIVHICGENATKILNLGCNFYNDYVVMDDLKMLQDVRNSVVENFKNIPLGDRLQYIISFDFYVKNKNQKRLIHHKMTPVCLTDDGDISKVLCLISLASGQQSGNVFAKKYGSDIYYDYNLLSHKWLQKNEIVLSRMEYLTLALSAQGFAMHDISRLICKSVDSVKSYKRALFDRMNVSNVTEALAFAQNHFLM